MEAIEFKAKIRNGNIRIPAKFKQKIGTFVKVIILNEQRTKQTNIIDVLLAKPLQLKNFTPLLRKDIYEKF